MGNNFYEVNRGDNLYNIVKTKYSLTNKTDIMNMVNKIAQANNIKNKNKLFVGQKIELKEELDLNSVSIMNNKTGEKTELKPDAKNKNYYRQDGIFGNIASKPEEFPDEQKTASNLKDITQSTEEVEDVIVDVKGFFTSDKSCDQRGFDIASKPVGVGGYTQMRGTDEKPTDAYELFLKVNEDDFKDGYFDQTKSDGKITVFSSEIIDGKEYLAMRDKEGKVHYFDKENNLSEYKKE